MRIRLSLHQKRSSSSRGRLAGGEGVRIPLTVAIMSGKRSPRRPAGVWNLRDVIIDTGADISCVSEEAVPLIKKALKGQLRIRKHIIVTAGGSVRLPVLENLIVCIRPPGKSLDSSSGCCVRTSLGVIPQMEEPMLLGRDLLSACKASVDFGKESMCFDGKDCLKMEGVE